MSSQRRPRRAVRPAGTVGTSDDVLLSRLPAPEEEVPSSSGPRPGAPPETADPADPAVARRSRDDSDVGWGERPEDDDRITRERPPHW